MALARALAVEPRILCLDEPFAALDKNLRLDMQVELKRIQREAGITTIMVTHDQEEALGLADRIAVFNAGRLEQFGTPEDIYDRPASAFVSGLVGHTNFLQRRLVEDSGPGVRIDLVQGATIRLPVGRPCGCQGPVLVSVRPDNLRLVESRGALSGTLRSAISRGGTVAYEIAVGDGAPLRVIAMRGAGPAAEPGATVQLDIVEPARCPVYLA